MSEALRDGAAMLPADVDPFPSTANPLEYVPRSASERVLHQWEMELENGTLGLALTGPPGIGKTMLARVLEHRLADRYGFVALPYAAFELDDLARWVLAELGIGEAGATDAHPVARLGEACREADRPVVLVIDDASALASEVVRGLAALLRSANGALRCIAILVDDRHTGRVLGAFGPAVVEYRLDAPLARDELGDYVRARLARVELPDALRERFGPEVLAWLHRDSRGIPRLVHELATRFLIETEAAQPGARLRKDDAWLDVGEASADATIEFDVEARPEAAAPSAAFDDAPGESRALAAPRTHGMRSRWWFLAALAIASLLVWLGR